MREGHQNSGMLHGECRRMQRMRAHLADQSGLIQQGGEAMRVRKRQGWGW